MKSVSALLALAAVVAVGWASGDAGFRVQLRLARPMLAMYLIEPEGVSGVGGVGFHYSINGRANSVRGVKTATGWAARVSVEGVPRGDVIAAADVYDANGNLRATTPRQGLSLASARSAPATIPSRQIRGAVTFRDDFNSDASIANNWRHEVSMYGGYNGEFQVYTNRKENVFTRNGMLYIKPTYTIDDSHWHDLYYGQMDMNQLYGTCTQSGVNGCHRDGKDGILPPIQSGKLKSVATLKYGTVTIRAKIPQGDWLWPAMWMLPKNSVYGGWPRSGEIDIMESRGNQGEYGVGHVSSTLHWGSDPGHNQFQRTSGKKTNSNWHNDFHEWRLEWTPDHLVTFIDNQQIMYVDPGSNFWSFGNLWSQGNNIWGGNKMAPFDQDFYMILNNAVGGTSGFFPDYVGGKCWANSRGQRLAQGDFWANRHQWQGSWHGDDTALVVDWIEFKSYY